MRGLVFLVSFREFLTPLSCWLSFPAGWNIPSPLRTIPVLKIFPSKMNVLVWFFFFKSGKKVLHSNVNQEKQNIWKKEEIFSKYRRCKNRRKKTGCKFTVLCFGNLHCNLNLKYLYMLKACLPANELCRCDWIRRVLLPSTESSFDEFAI